MGGDPARVESHNAASLRGIPVLCSGLVRPPGGAAGFRGRDVPVVPAGPLSGESLRRRGVHRKSLACCEVGRESLGYNRNPDRPDKGRFVHRLRRGSLSAERSGEVVFLTGSIRAVRTSGACRRAQPAAGHDETGHRRGMGLGLPVLQNRCAWRVEPVDELRRRGVGFRCDPGWQPPATSALRQRRINAEPEY